jgi:proton-translocating NADH-quinone oxidoreductase chain M
MKNYIYIITITLIILIFNIEFNLMTSFVSDYINTFVKTQINTYNILNITSKLISYRAFPDWVPLPMKIDFVYAAGSINKVLVRYVDYSYWVSTTSAINQYNLYNILLEKLYYNHAIYTFNIHNVFDSNLIYIYKIFFQLIYIIVLLFFKVKFMFFKFIFFSLINYNTTFFYKLTGLNFNPSLLYNDILLYHKSISELPVFFNEAIVNLQVTSIIFFYVIFILLYSLIAIFYKNIPGNLFQSLPFFEKTYVFITQLMLLQNNTLKKINIIFIFKKFINILRIIFIIFFMFEIALYILKSNGANLTLIHYTVIPDFYEYLFSFFFDIKYTYNYDIFLSNFLLGYDGITLLFLFLTLIVFGMVHLNLGTKKFTIYQYQFLIFLTILLEIQLIITFTVQNLLIFYIFFESTLIPMFFIVGFFGTRSRKVVAAFYLFLYTIIGSLFLLLGILIIYSYTKTFTIPEIYQYNFPINTQILLWILFFFGFAVKLPSIPFHLWLPEAHVEAPAIGSIILAAILLKLGAYGLLRVSLKMFPEACLFFQPLVFVIGLVSIIYASLTAIRQTDIKRVIAYSSIAHMNYALIGLFCFNKLALAGSFYLMFGHGLVSGGLFLLIGILYERYGTRSIFYYGGLMKVMPHFSVIFLILSLANMGFPGLINFIGEFLIMLGIAEENMLLFFLTSLGFILSAVYSIWLFNRLAFGNLKSNYLIKYKDLTEFEVKSTFIKLVLILIFYFGISTEFLTLLIDQTLTYYLIDYQYNIDYLKNIDFSYFK